MIRRCYQLSIIVDKSWNRNLTNEVQLTLTTAEWTSPVCISQHSRSEHRHNTITRTSVVSPTTHNTNHKSQSPQRQLSDVTSLSVCVVCVSVCVVYVYVCVVMPMSSIVPLMTLTTLEPSFMDGGRNWDNRILTRIRSSSRI